MAFKPSINTMLKKGNEDLKVAKEAKKSGDVAYKIALKDLEIARK